jgi:hypothetical protein
MPDWLDYVRRNLGLQNLRNVDPGFATQNC